MTKTELIAAYEREIAMRRRELQNEINAAVDRLTRQAESTHLGHNLANHASAISVLHGKIEAAEMALRSIKELSLDAQTEQDHEQARIARGEL